MRFSYIVVLILFQCSVLLIDASSNGGGGYPPPPPPPPSAAAADFYSEYTKDNNPEEYPPNASSENAPPPPQDDDQAEAKEFWSTTETSSSSNDPTVTPSYFNGDDRQEPPATSSTSSSYGGDERNAFNDRQGGPPPRNFDNGDRRGGRPPPRDGRPPPAGGRGPNNNFNDRRPPSSGLSNPNPIDYQFPATTNGGGGDDRDGRDGGEKRSASARRDIVAQYMSTGSGKLQVYSGSTAIGGSLGYYLAKSFLPVSSSVMISFGSIMCFLFTALRTPIGELMRAMSLSLILVLQRTSRIRKRYPTWTHVPGCLTGRRRRDDRGRPRAFPPTANGESPWRYQPRRRDDVDFNMLYSLIAMAFVGSTCGGNIPLVPTWMGALGGAGVFGLGCMAQSPRGDLCRTLGMRVVALLMELWEIQAQLKLIPKAAVVSGQIIDKAMILDRKHRVKDRFLSFATSSYNRVMEMTSTTGEGSDERSRRRREDDDRRGRDDDERDGPPRRRPGRRGDDDDEDFRRRPRPRRGDDDDDKDDFRRRPRPRRGDDDDDLKRDKPRRDDNDDDRRRRGGDPFDDDRRRRRPDENHSGGDADPWKDMPDGDDEPKKGRLGRLFRK